MATVKVHFPNGGFNVVRHGDNIDIKGIISTVTERLSTGERDQKVYAMRLSRVSSSEVIFVENLQRNSFKMV